jgi:hypothetical protein
MRPVDERQVRQYVLYKQHLLEGTQGDRVVPVVEDLVALHATSASTPYLSLFARMRGFQRVDLDRAFYVERQLIRLEAMRGTLFITSTAAAPMLFQATHPSEAELAKWLQEWRIPQSEYRTLTDHLTAILREGGKPLSVIRGLVPERLVRPLEQQTGSTVNRTSNLNVVLAGLMRQGLVVSEKGTEPLLTTSANRYALLLQLYPQLKLDVITRDQAMTALVRRYLGAFGPVLEQDILWWIGATKSETDAALAALAPNLCRVFIKHLSDEYVMLEEDYTRLIKFKPSKKPSLSLLPYEDPYTKGFKVRNRLIDPDQEKLAYVGGGVEPTIVLDGRVVGTWNRTIESGRGPIQIHLFQSLKGDLKKTLVQKAKTLGKLMLQEEPSVELEITR